MKFRIYAITCGIEETILETDSLKTVRDFYRDNQNALVRVDVDGDRLTISEGLQLMSTSRHAPGYKKGLLS